MTIGIAALLILAPLSPAPPSAPACSTGEEAAAGLRAAHEAQRRAHLEGDAELLAAGMADQMVLVSNGNLFVQPREKMLSFFKGYLERVRYLEWSDAEPLVIHVSPDGQMGWTGVKVRARYVERAKPQAGEKAFKSSWIATYQRVGCEWKLTGNASAVVDD
jgi:hypothetical protein